jgi:hypothetical protein
MVDLMCVVEQGSQIGHHLPLAVTFEFLKLSGSKWPLYGAEVGTLFGSTRAKS